MHARRRLPPRAALPLVLMLLLARRRPSPHTAGVWASTNVQGVKYDKAVATG
jgi:hypothetical protein